MGFARPFDVFAPRGESGCWGGPLIGEDRDRGRPPGKERTPLHPLRGQGGYPLAATELHPFPAGEAFLGWSPPKSRTVPSAR